VIVDRGPEGNPRGRERLAETVAQARAIFPNRQEAAAYVRQANPRRSPEAVEASLTYAFREQPDGSFSLKYDQRLRDRFLEREGSGVDLWQAIDHISCPVLIVRGGESDVLSDEVARKMQARLPNALYETVPGAGHTVMLDNPPGFNAVVEPFFP
jgi:pimeloyl-ACP methyl ester carboxylesterase